MKTILISEHILQAQRVMEDLISTTNVLIQFLPDGIHEIKEHIESSTLPAVRPAPSILSWDLTTTRTFQEKTRTANDRVVKAIDRQLTVGVEKLKAAKVRKSARLGAGRAEIRFWRPGAMN
jgi:hypothetical protein